MLKRELKVNIRNFLLWNIILIGTFLVVFLVYPSITSNNNMDMLDAVMEMFPPEILKAFNMDISSINSAFGWLKTEGFVFIYLIIGCYAGILGSNLLLKEENDKTIEYLNSLPVTRREIVCCKFFCGLILVIAMILVIAVFNYISLLLSGDFNSKVYLLLAITPLFPSIVIYALCMFLSTFTHKTKKVLGISLGVVFISYILYMLSSLDTSIEFLKYMSIFTLADIRYVIQHESIQIGLVILSVCLTIGLFYLIIYRYNKKELV